MTRLALPAITATLLLLYGLLSNEPVLEGTHALEVLYAAGLICAGILAVHVTSYIVVELIQSRADGRRPSHLLRMLILALLYAAAAIVLMRSVLGVDVVSIAAASAITAAVLGFALQATLSNFFSGVAMRLEWPSPMRLGDTVEIGGQRGRLETITWRSITLRTAEGVRVVIPNESFASGTVSVYPQSEPCESTLEFTTLSKIPPETVEAIVLEEMNTMPGIVRGRSRVDCGAFDAQPGGTRTHKVRFTPIEVAAIDAVEAVLRERLWYAFDRAGLLGPAISDDADRCKLRQLLAAAPFASAASEAGLQETVRDSVRLAYANGSKVELDKTDPTAAYAVVAGRLLEHRGGAVIGTHRGTTALDAKIKTVKDLSDELTRFIGPIADWLVWSAAARTSDLHALYHQLAQEIDAPDQRAEFLALAPKRKAVWHDAGAIVSLTPKGEGVREVSGALEASASLILFRIVLPPSAATPLEEGRQVAEQA